MQRKKIGNVLKSARNRMGVSVQYVLNELEQKDIRIKTSTLYGYENNQNIPDGYVLIALCDIYKIDDILTEFGYSKSSAGSPAITIADEPHKTAIQKYLELNPEHQANIRGIIDGYAFEEQNAEKRDSDTEFANELA